MTGTMEYASCDAVFVTVFQNQWDANQGRCGICGDPFQGPRDNEAGGKYATGIITRAYSESDVIDVRVVITAFQRGWYEFRICPNNNVTRPATQACLDRYLLEFEDGTTRHFPSGRGSENLRLRLPQGLTCQQCVLQWKWNSGKYISSQS